MSSPSWAASREEAAQPNHSSYVGTLVTPAHAMATLFRALAGHTKVYSVRLPEADYTIAVKVSAADSCK